MRGHGWVPTAALLTVLLGTFVYAVAEQLTLTTYYPSPRGVYQELRANTIMGADIDLAEDLNLAGDAPHDTSQLLLTGRTAPSRQLALGVETSDNYGFLQARDGAATRPLLLNPDGGNVGVGTGSTLPSDQLVVRTSSGHGGLLLNNTAADGDPRVRFQLSGTTVFSFGVDDSDGDKFKISAADALDTNTRLTIDSAGRVGVGSASPGAALTVRTLRASDGVVIQNAAGDGDPVLRFEVSGGGAGELVMGLDDSVSDDFLLAQGPALTDTPYFRLNRSSGAAFWMGGPVTIEPRTFFGGTMLQLHNVSSQHSADSDAAIGFNTDSARRFTLGVDFTDGNRFKISAGPLLGGADDRLILDAVGNLTVPTGQLQLANLAGDPATAVGNGALYYNTTAHKTRVYENGAWKDLGVAGARFVGATSDVLGNIGGYAGANTNCHNVFPGSRMCVASDFVNGLPNVDGWYSAYAAPTDFTGNFPLGWRLYVNTDCYGWITSGGCLDIQSVCSKMGPVWRAAPDNRPGLQECSTASPILCCR